MSAHLRLASVNGTTLLAQPVEKSASAPCAQKGTLPKPPRVKRAVATAEPPAESNPFKSLVRGLPDSGLESTLIGLQRSLLIVEQERLRRAMTMAKGPVAKASPDEDAMDSATCPQFTKPNSGSVEADGKSVAVPKKAARAIVAADAEFVLGERLVSEAGTPLAYRFSGMPWTLSRTAAERRGVPHLGGKTVCYAWGRPLSVTRTGASF